MNATTIDPIFTTISDEGIRRLAEANAKACAAEQHNRQDSYWKGQMDAFQILWQNLPMSDKQRMGTYFHGTYYAELARWSELKKGAVQP